MIIRQDEQIPRDWMNKLLDAGYFVELTTYFNLQFIHHSWEYKKEFSQRTPEQIWLFPEKKLAKVWF